MEFGVYVPWEATATKGASLDAVLGNWCSDWAAHGVRRVWVGNGPDKPQDHATLIQRCKEQGIRVTTTPTNPTVATLQALQSAGDADFSLADNFGAGLDLSVYLPLAQKCAELGITATFTADTIRMEQLWAHPGIVPYAALFCYPFLSIPGSGLDTPEQSWEWYGQHVARFSVRCRTARIRPWAMFQAAADSEMRMPTTEEVLRQCDVLEAFGYEVAIAFCYGHITACIPSRPLFRPTSTWRALGERKWTGRYA